MEVRLFSLVLAALSGTIMALQGTLNTGMSRTLGLLEATFIVHLVGLILVSVLLFLLNMGNLDVALFTQVPWYNYLGGILGVIIVYLVMKSISQVGVAAATTAIILGQVFTAGFINHFGFFGIDKVPFNWCKVGGTLLMAGGAWLLLRR